MDNLRLILLIIGCFAVLGIYLWEIFHKGAPRNKTGILDAVDDIPDLPLPPMNNDETSDYHLAMDNLGSLLTKSRDQTMSVDDTAKVFNISETTKNMGEPDEDLPLEMSVKDYETNLFNNNNNNNDCDLFSAIEEDGHVQEEFDDKEKTDIELVEQEVEIPKNNKFSEDLLVLYITSPTHILFNGLSISKAADEVGMVYGHMNIFHHFGPGKLHSGQPLFSIANMYEPGSFDLGRMADLKTKGIAAFMYSPASIDVSVVFELYLNTIQRIAELLGGEVRTSDNEPLNSAAINSLRDKAESLSDS